MKIKQVKLETIIPYARNPRNHRGAVDKVASSIKEYKFRQPIVVDEDNVIIAGHARYLAAQKLGLAKVPVHVAEGLTAAQVKAYRLADNRTGEESIWDDELLSLELDDLEGDIDLSLTGFDTDEIAVLLASVTEGLTDEDDIPEIQDSPVSETGDIWLLGNHRLMCGDSTSLKDVEQLMDNQKADLVFTDPPYNVDYQGYTKEKLKIKNDAMSNDQFINFLDAVFHSYKQSVKDDASLYVCHASTVLREFQNSMESAGFVIRNQIIWAKNHFAWGLGRYKYQHEPIWYAHVKDQNDAWYGDHTQSTVWTEKKPAANRLHPTMKPVELIERALLNSSKVYDLVIDFFGGSGSTLIACEKNGRSANIMEIDPVYVDVILRRWQDFTGQPAYHEDGQTYDEIAKLRTAAA